MSESQNNHYIHQNQQNFNFLEKIVQHFSTEIYLKDASRGEGFNDCFRSNETHWDLDMKCTYEGVWSWRVCFCQQKSQMAWSVMSMSNLSYSIAVATNKIFSLAFSRDVCTQDHDRLLHQNLQIIFFIAGSSTSTGITSERSTENYPWFWIEKNVTTLSMTMCVLHYYDTYIIPSICKHWRQSYSSTSNLHRSPSQQRNCNESKTERISFRGG